MSFSTFDLANDVASVVSSINEVVSISSSLFSNNLNVKFFQNIVSGTAATDFGGYWETFYDSSPTSSLSTALVDVTYGYHTSSIYNVAATVSSSFNEKNKIYVQMASLLLGNPDTTFTINSSGSTEAIFLLVKRNVMKDELKKGPIQIVFNQTGSQFTGSDARSNTSFKQGIGGDYAPLKSGSVEIGQIWYNAGVIVLNPKQIWDGATPWSGTAHLDQIQYSGNIGQVVDGFRQLAVSGNGGVQSITFHNQTNLFSTVYFCRARNSEYNYSSNPTFVDSNQRIRVTSGSNILQTRTYITTLGLYDASDNLLAAAKLNKPITKSPDNEAVFRIRLDY